ncbi:MAG: FkbM family methyltransferase [Burkholderiales bacterium]
MIQHQGIWLPDGEKHLVEWMNASGEIVDGNGTYQIKKLRAALLHVKQFRTAVDVGAHVGFFSMHLAKRFRQLHAFEPVAAHRECFAANVFTSGRGGDVTLHDCALGAEAGAVALETPLGSSGGAHISGEGDIAMLPLDSFELQDVDFVKIDCEGYELAVVQGAAETMKRCRPCVIVEQKQHIMAGNFGTSGTPAVDFLLSLGAKQRAVISGDHILSWDWQ